MAARLGCTATLACLREFRDEGHRHRNFAQRAAQHGPVHGFVTEDAGRGLGQFAVTELRHRGEIGAYRVALQPGGKAQHVGLVGELVGGEGVFHLGYHRGPPELGHGRGEQLGMRAVVALELLREPKRRGA